MTSLLKAAVAVALVLGAPQDREDLKRARAAFRKGDYEGAERMFERLSALRPDSWELRAGLVRACLEQGKRDPARRAAEEFLGRSPGHEGASVALASTWVDGGEPARALELLGRFNTAPARSLATRALWDLERMDDAVRMGEPLVDLYNTRRDDLMKEDLFALAQGLIVVARLSGQSDLYKQVVHLVLPDLLKADPADSWVRAFLGRCYLDKYNAAAAEAEFGAALQANPNCVPALLGQARVLLGAGRGEEALAACRRAAAVNASSEEAFALEAEILLVRQDRDGAIAAADRGLASRPNSARLRSLRAAARHLKDDAGYEEDVRRALEANPRTPLPYWEVARLHLATGSRRFEEAHAFLRKAVEQNGQIPDLLIDYGMSCLRVADEETGRKILREANRKDPFHVRVQNVVNLLDRLDRDFETVAAGPCRLRLDRSEKRWTEPHAKALLDRASREMAARYGFSPSEPVLVELFTRHGDFSVRTLGVPGLGALGACFGRVVTTLSPRARVADAGLPAYSWAAVLWHEMAHVYSLQLSKYRVPAWLTEGLATHEERLGFRGPRREADLQILLARHRGLLGGVAELDSGRPAADPILSVYLQGAEITAYLSERHGFESVVRLLRGYALGRRTPELFQEVFKQTLAEFDRSFFGWLDARLARFKYRLPAREPAARLLADAQADPKDSGAAARLAFSRLESGDEKGAAEWGKRAVAADPASALAHAAYGQALWSRKDLDEAIEHLRRGTDDYQNWLTLGRALAERERWREAAESFRRAAACFPAWIEDPSGEGVHYRLNAALLAAQDREGALAAFEAMVAADPLDFRNRLRLASIHQERGDLARMAAVLEEASWLETRDVALLDLQAALHRARKEHAVATDRSLAAIAILEADGKEDDPGKADRFCAIGEDWLARGDREKALEYAQEALRLVSGLERARKLYDAARKR
jgi:tetratricopeptide (TPR) repeat protein